MTSHPQHDLVAKEVRSWYTDWPGRAPGPPGSAPDLGVRTRREFFGYLRDGPGAGGRLVLTIDDPADLAGALRSAERFYGSGAFDVWVDERWRADLLEATLNSDGFHCADATIVLALVGPLHSAAGPAHLEVREVTDETTLALWAAVKLRGFSDSEREPPDSMHHDELTARTAEWPITRYELAVLEGEAAAILAHYTASQDQMVFLLATRLPFRHRGIAQSMLRGWAERATAAGVRSLLINCDEHGRPAALYRRMGFVDEVYWHRRYRRTST